MRFPPALLLIVWACVPVTAAPGDANPGDAYLALVVRYQSGDREAVATALAEWSTSDLDVALRGVPAALRAASAKSGFSRSALIATAMVAHLDVVGRADRTGDLNRHLAAGQRLADLLPPDGLDQSVRRFRAGWHLAAGTAMLRLAKYDAASQQFEIALRLRPLNPQILLALGSVHEIQGTVSLEADVEPQEARAAVPRKQARQSIDERLERAAASYRAALAAAPDLYEARLRLARTLQLQRRLDAADREVRMFDARVSDDYLRYLTLLISGSISEAVGRSDEAIARYRDAASLCRGCHSATLALSHALLKRGDRGVARGLVERLVNVPVWLTPADPWLDYRTGQWRRFGTILEQLQREVPA